MTPATATSADIATLNQKLANIVEIMTRVEQNQKDTNTKIDALDARLRAVEMSDSKSAILNSNNIASLEVRVSEVEKYAWVLRFGAWLVPLTGALVIALVWAILTHTVTLGP